MLSEAAFLSSGEQWWEFMSVACTCLCWSWLTFFGSLLTVKISWDASSFSKPVHSVPDTLYSYVPIAPGFFKETITSISEMKETKLRMTQVSIYFRSLLPYSRDLSHSWCMVEVIESRYVWLEPTVFACSLSDPADCNRVTFGSYHPLISSCIPSQVLMGISSNSVSCSSYPSTSMSTWSIFFSSALDPSGTSSLAFCHFTSFICTSIEIIGRRNL